MATETHKEIDSQTIIRKLERLEKQNRQIINLLMQQTPVKRWMKAHDLLKLVGKSAGWLRQRREDDLVEFKKEGKSFFYNIDSLPSQFIKNP